MSRGPRPLTKAQVDARAKRKKIYDLRKEKYSWLEVGQMMALEPATCEKYFRAAVKKDGLEPFESPDAGKGCSHEVQRPDEVAKVLVDATTSALLDDDPRFKELRESLKAAGMTPKMIAAILKRMKSQYAPAVAEIRRFTAKELVEQLETKTALVLGHIDEFAVAQAGLKDLSIAANILIEKTQLLKNQPTQILDVTSRMQVNALLPVMLAEARRRGITIEGSSERIG